MITPVLLYDSSTLKSTAHIACYHCSVIIYQFQKEEYYNYNCVRTHNKLQQQSSTTKTEHSKSKLTQCYRIITAWLEAKEETTWLKTKKDDTLTLHAYQQRYHKGCPPPEKEHVKRIIYGTSITLNDNIYSWNMNNATTLIDAYTTTWSDVAAAIVIDSIAAAIGIASTAIANTATIVITGYKTAEAAVVAATAKAIKLPTIFITNIDDKGTTVTEITQEQTRGYLSNTTSYFTQE